MNKLSHDVKVNRFCVRVLKKCTFQFGKVNKTQHNIKDVTLTLKVSQKQSVLLNLFKKQDRFYNGSVHQHCHSQWYQCQASSSVWSSLKRVTKGNESAWLCVFKVTEKEALNIFVSVLIPVDKGRQIVAACFISDDLCFIMNHGNNLPLFRFHYDSFPCSRSQFWLCFFQNYVCVCVCPPSCPVVFFVCFFVSICFQYLTDGGGLRSASL